MSDASKRSPLTLTGAAVAGILGAQLASACAGPSAPIQPPDTEPIVEPVALDLMRATQRYHGLEGGLVDNALPQVTPAYGRIVIIAISMSNGKQEFDRFMALFDGHTDVDPAIGLVNCARGGNALERWLERQSLWDDCRTAVRNAGFSPGEVRVVWAKNANQFTDHGRTLPDPAADYYDLVENISALSQRIGQEFPSVQAIFHTSRIYAGYVRESRQAARGEPLSYEGGYAINEVIRRQQRGELAGAPWIGWGPYLWADGTKPNSFGVQWEPADFEGAAGDDPHPSLQGETKVAEALHAFLLGFDWYRR